MRLVQTFAAIALSIGLLSCASHAEDASPVVGLQTVLITDTTRQDVLASSAQRQWMVDIYYRAEATERADGDVYARDADLLQAMIEDGFYGVEATTLRSWAQAPSPAIANADPTSAGSRPLILLSPGSGIPGFTYAQVASSLVERGYVVAVVNHPYLGLSRLPNGHMLNAADDPVQAIEDPAALTPRILEWSADLSVTLDQLAEASIPIDFDHVLAVGHSTGGAIALDACTQDPRIDACMNFEGALFGSRAETGGVAKPVVSIGSRARGRPRGTGMGEQMLAALSQSGNVSAWYVFVSGGSHMSFSDAPRMMPSTLTRFGGEIFPPDRSDEIYGGMVDAFARAYVTGAGGDTAFEAFLAQQPEIEFQSSAGRRSPERG
jgi:dienelactone hydrolase